MAAVVEAASSVVSAATDTVSSVGNAVADVGNTVVEQVVQPVAKAVENTVQAAIDDPIGTAVKVAAVASGNPVLVAAANTAVAIAHGADMNDALESGIKAGVTAGIAQGVADAVNMPEVGSVTGPDNIDVGGGFNPATGAASLVPTTPPPATTAGNIAKGTTSAVLQGQDPLQALMSGGISAGTSAITSQIEGFDQLPPSAQKAVNNAVSTALQGGDPSQALVNSAISAGIAEVKAQYNSSGLKAGDTGTTENVFDPTYGGTIPAEAPVQAPVEAPVEAPVQAPTEISTELPTVTPQEELVPKTAPVSQVTPEPISTVNNQDGTVTQVMSDGSVRALDLGTGEVIPVAPAPEAVSSDIPTSDIPTEDMGEIVITDKRDPYIGDIQMDLDGVPVVTPTTDTPAPVTPTTAPLSTFAGLDRKSTRLNSSHIPLSRMPSSA